MYALPPLLSVVAGDSVRSAGQYGETLTGKGRKKKQHDRAFIKEALWTEI